MKLEEKILKRLTALESQLSQITMVQRSGSSVPRADYTQFQAWAISAMGTISGIFGPQSAHAEAFRKIYGAAGMTVYPSEIETLKGIFQAAKNDYEGGYLFSVTSEVSGEIFGDFVILAKRCLEEGHKDVAAVLACAALEDALKAYATANNIDVMDKTMQDIVNALKAKGLVAGAQKSLLDVMPKIRDYAMHANWEKIKSEDVSSIIGFVEQFLIAHF